MAFGTAFAKDQSVAFIDMSYILKNLPQYEQANEQLTMLSKRWQKEIDAAQQEARVLATNYQTEQIFLSETVRAEREQEIVKKEQDVLELKRKYFGQDGELYKKREALIIDSGVQFNMVAAHRAWWASRALTARWTPSPPT